MGGEKPGVRVRSPRSFQAFARQSWHQRWPPSASGGDPRQFPHAQPFRREDGLPSFRPFDLSTFRPFDLSTFRPSSDPAHPARSANPTTARCVVLRSCGRNDGDLGFHIMPEILVFVLRIRDGERYGTAAAPSRARPGCTRQGVCSSRRPIAVSAQAGPAGSVEPSLRS
jgi:hypothetical protein